MNNRISLQKMCAAALLLACGLILPQVFHLFGGRAAGSVFSPMHIPVLLCGLLLGGGWGTAVGALTPLLSSLMLGMPPFALLPFMLCELAAYGLVSGLLGKRLPLYPALLGAQVAGRIVYACALFVGGTVFGLACAAPVSVLTSVATGLPGLILQWIFVPAAVRLLRLAGQRSHAA